MNYFQDDNSVESAEETPVIRDGKRFKRKEHSEAIVTIPAIFQEKIGEVTLEDATLADYKQRLLPLKTCEVCRIEPITRAS